MITAFLAGLLSFISPCVLPLVPSYLMYLSGLSFQQLAHSTEYTVVKQAVVMNAVLFILGFSAVFIAFGASASVLGQVLLDHQDAIRKAGAILMIIFGLHVSGMVKLTWLMTERRMHLTARPVLWPPSSPEAHLRPVGPHASDLYSARCSCTRPRQTPWSMASPYWPFIH